MASPITIGGQTVTLTWTQEVARRFAFRASKIGGGPSFEDFLHKTKAASAVTTFLWLILPPAVHSRYATPEDLFLATAEEDAGTVSFSNAENTRHGAVSVGAAAARS